MKISPLFLSLIFATSTLVVAQDCTVAELSTISSIYSSAIGGSCPNTTASTGNGDYCSDSDCVNFMSDMLEKLPNCSTDGINVKERVQAVVDFCDTGSIGTNSSDQVTDDTTPSPTDDSLTSSSTSSFGFALFTAAFAVTAFLTGL